MSHADDMLDGSNCQECSRFIGSAEGYPRTCHRCRDEQEAIRGLERMVDAQKKELTASMLRFTDDTHVIRITGDSKGMLQCTVRSRTRQEQGVDYNITFIKKPRQGVVYTFMSGDRLSFLAFEPNHPGLIG